MALHRFASWIPTLVLLACFGGCNSGADGPLEPAELAQYQACNVDDDCVLADNDVDRCCSGNTIANPVAIAKTQLEAFRDAFDDPDCENEPCPAIAYIGPEQHLDWLQNKYVPRCNAGSCELLVHEDAWTACTDNTQCSDEYECREGYGFDACWYVGPQ